MSAKYAYRRGEHGMDILHKASGEVRKFATPWREPPIPDCELELIWATHEPLNKQPLTRERVEALERQAAREQFRLRAEAMERDRKDDERQRRLEAARDSAAKQRARRRRGRVYREGCRPVPLEKLPPYDASLYDTAGRCSLSVERLPGWAEHIEPRLPFGPEPHIWAALDAMPPPGYYNARPEGAV